MASHLVARAITRRAVSLVQLVAAIALVLGAVSASPPTRVSFLLG